MSVTSAISGIFTRLAERRRHKRLSRLLDLLVHDLRLRRIEELTALITGAALMQIVR